jgi:hypothetical protein
VAEEEFNFEAEFALLDIGATSSMLRTGSVRPTVLAFSPTAGVEAIALDWEEGGAPRAFEEARRYARDLQATAYALIAHITKNGQILIYHLPGAAPSPANEFLGIALFADDGEARGVLYPVRRAGGALSFGMPTVTDAETTDWCPLGDLWGNPFCVGDTVRFLPRERAVDPTTPLWRAIVELTRLRIHEDQPRADEYMAFLDDLRNGIFAVVGRPDDVPDRVLLRPRTHFNPLGTLDVEASRLIMADRAVPEVDAIGDRVPVR